MKHLPPRQNWSTLLLILPIHQKNVLLILPNNWVDTKATLSDLNQNFGGHITHKILAPASGKWLGQIAEWKGKSALNVLSNGKELSRRM